MQVVRPSLSPRSFQAGAFRQRLHSEFPVPGTARHLSWRPHWCARDSRPGATRAMWDNRSTEPRVVAIEPKASGPWCPSGWGWARSSIADHRYPRRLAVYSAKLWICVVSELFQHPAPRDGSRTRPLLVVLQKAFQAARKDIYVGAAGKPRSPLGKLPLRAKPAAASPPVCLSGQQWAAA